MRPARLGALLTLLLAASAALSAPSAEEEIAQLLDFVAHSGCEFERNGSRHTSADAADHLRLKYARGKRYVASAEQFIDRLATQSSWTGKPYRVRCAGVERPAGEWLHEALQGQRHARARPAP